MAFSYCSLVNDFTTRTPDSESSTLAFISPNSARMSVKPARMRLFHLPDSTSMNGTSISSISVSFQFMVAMIVNVPISMHTDIRKSSGPW